MGGGGLDLFSHLNHNTLKIENKRSVSCVGEMKKPQGTHKTSRSKREKTYDGDSKQTAEKQ